MNTRLRVQNCTVTQATDRVPHDLDKSKVTRIIFDKVFLAAAAWLKPNNL